MPFKKGKPKTGGRLPGVSNKFTGAFHEAVQIVYNRLGGHAAFLEWARKNRTEYYRIAARLIPGEMQDGNGERSIRVIVYGSQPAVDVRPALPDHSTSEVENVEAS
jgi:hypothetical protein